MSYLYLKETRSSFAIEGETLTANRHERFVAQLEQVSAARSISADDLIQWQRELVEPRYAASGFRTSQEYVAEPRRGRLPRVQYIAPKPEDVEPLMRAFFQLGALLSEAPPLVHAVAWSFAFVSFTLLTTATAGSIAF